MNTFREITFKPLLNESDEEPWGWYTNGPPFQEIALTMTHYFKEVEKHPPGNFLRPHFNRTCWDSGTFETGRQISQDGETDGEELMYCHVYLYTSHGIVAPNDGLLAIYEFIEGKRMRVVFNVVRGDKGIPKGYEVPHPPGYAENEKNAVGND